MMSWVPRIKVFCSTESRSWIKLLNQLNIQALEELDITRRERLQVIQSDLLNAVCTPENIPYDQGLYD